MRQNKKRPFQKNKKIKHLFINFVNLTDEYSSLSVCSLHILGKINCLLFRLAFQLPVWAGSQNILQWAPEQDRHRRGEECVRWPERGRQSWRRCRSERKGRRGRWSGSPGCGRGCCPVQASLVPWPKTSAGTHPDQQTHEQNTVFYKSFKSETTKPTQMKQF